MIFFEFYLANPAQKKPCKLPAPLFMFSHMAEIWCQNYCDFMKISRFENVIFVCLSFCRSLRIIYKGVENKSFQECLIISQKLKACSTCSKNPADGPPPYIQVQNEQYMWRPSSSIILWGRFDAKFFVISWKHQGLRMFFSFVWVFVSVYASFVKV